MAGLLSTDAVKLSEITIPKSVKVIGGSAFTSCPALKKATIPKDIQVKDGKPIFDPNFKNINN